MLNQFDYYYGMEAEQFTFYRIPKILFVDERFKTLSSDAKLLYGLMLDRMSLSMKNGWVDENNRVYIYYTMERIMEDLGCAREKCTKVVAELDSKKGIGLIEKKRQGLGKPDMIFVKNFMIAELKEDKDILEKDIQNTEFRKSNFKKSENQISSSSIGDNSEDGKTNLNKTERSETNNSESNHISSEGSDLNDEMNEVEIYGKVIKENICYEALISTYPLEKETIEGIFELILETVVNKNKVILISSNRYPIELVKSKFLKLDCYHIEYVLECMKKNTSEIKNIKKYMMAALFNATSTINSYYRAQVNHDMPQFVQM